MFSTRLPFRRVWTAIVLTSTAFATSAANAPKSWATVDRAYDQRHLQRDLDRIHALGVTGVLGEARSGTARHAARSGVADLETGRPVPYGAHFRLASGTKTFTAAVVLQLVGEGRLGLDDTVESWLPGLVRGNGNDGTKITVRRLLQHTSGLYDYDADLPIYTEDGFLRHRFDTYRPEQLAAMAVAHPPLWVPGPGDRRWSYSNTNYVLAGMIVEKVTGRSWAQEIHDRIIQPLRLADTITPGTSPHVPRPRAKGYEQFTANGALTDVTLLNPSLVWAAGELLTTTTDLHRFWRALLNGELLRPTQQAKLLTTVDAPALHVRWPGARYGLGIMRRPLTCSGEEPRWYWTHGGDAMGYSTRNAFTHDGRRGIVLFLSAHLHDRSTGLEIDNTVDQAAERLLCARP
jgi:D-alanyl-D-alanine carboxypeptidase